MKNLQMPLDAGSNTFRVGLQNAYGKYVVLKFRTTTAVQAGERVDIQVSKR
jgi:hypothetical protein